MLTLSVTREEILRMIDCLDAIFTGAELRDRWRDGYEQPSHNVMAGLVPAIHALLSAAAKTWMPGTRPGMTTS